MLKQFKIIDGKVTENGGDNPAVQIYINPDDKEKAFLINTLQIDEHTLISALDPEELSRIEFEANHTAVILKRPKRYSSEDNFLFKVSSIGMFLFSDRLVILLSDDINLFDNRMFQKIRSLTDVFLKIIFRCIQHFEEHLNIIHKISNELEVEITKALTNKDVFYMFNLEKSLVYYLKATGTNVKVVEKIKTNAARIGLTPEDSEFLEDLNIETVQCHEEANTYLQLISNLMDAWVSMVSNNLNIRMKTLTILSICIMLPTLIVSIFSMNVKLPVPQNGTIWPFVLVSTLSVLSIFLIMFISRHRKW